MRFLGLFTKNQHIGGNCSKREGGGGASRGLGEIGWMVLLKEGGGGDTPMHTIINDLTKQERIRIMLKTNLNVRYNRDKMVFIILEVAKKND